MIDWLAIIVSMPLALIICFIGWVFLEYPFIRNKEKSVFKTFWKWYNQF